MKEVLKKYSGVLFFYIVIVSMILLVNARFNYLKNQELDQNSNLVAMNK